MRVFIDLDGVVCDLVEGLMRRHDKPYPFADIQGDEAWNVGRTWGMTEDDLWGRCGFSFWAGLLKTPEADAIVDILSQAFGVQSLCFLSHPVATHGCADGKRQWVQMAYPHIPLLLTCCRPGDSPPKHFLAGDDSFLVDDHTPNVDRFESAGGWSFLYPRQWNRRHKHEHDGVELLIEYIRGFGGTYRNFTYKQGVET